ncbi:HDOD domain-containing protein [Agaribacter flavus]|uniref:HDOD domain-containing protein n=1 Tax=Agaribacter flavus TaxID=1902781 RepID=A0ABV7FND4_9ALTE
MSISPIVKYATHSFTLPDTCVRLRTMLDDPLSSIEDMAKVMSVDPSLSAKVLKLANSALFRFPAQVSSVPKALSIIGGEAAYNISMAETANLAFKSFASDNINFGEFWHKAILTGLIAKSIVQQKGIRGSERYFVVGILHHLSELVCATKLPEKYVEYKSAIAEDTVAMSLQQRFFGFTFAECSGLILKSWNLPESIYEPLLTIELTGSNLGQFEQAVVYLSAAMAQVKLGREVFDKLEIPRSVTETIGLNDYEYDIIFEFAQAESTKIASALN